MNGVLIEHITNVGKDKWTGVLIENLTNIVKDKWTGVLIEHLTNIGKGKWTGYQSNILQILWRINEPGINRTSYQYWKW